MRSIPKPPFDELRPLLGSKIDALEAAWITGRPEERTEIEITFELLQRQAKPRDAVLFPSPPAQQADGPLRLGRIVHGHHALGWLGLTKRELCQHLGVFGRSGSGKSVACLRLMVQLLRQSTPWLIFDWKRSARALRALDLPEEVHVVSWGRHLNAALSFNILTPPPGVPIDTHMRLLSEMIAGTWCAGDGVISLLERAMRTCYQKHAPEHPIIADVLTEVQAMRTTARETLWRQSTLRILTQMTTGQLGRILNRRRDSKALDQLLSKHTIIELDGLAVNDASFLTQHVMRYLTHSLLETPVREELQFVCLVEEAHHLLAKSGSGTSRESILETCLREGRECGLGIVLVDQTISSISPVALANCYLAIVLNCRQHNDVSTASKTLLLTDEQRSMLSTLPVGQAIARLSDRWPKPVHICIPNLPLPKGSVTDADITNAFLGGPYAQSALDALQDDSPSEGSRESGGSGGSGGSGDFGDTAAHRPQNADQGLHGGFPRSDREKRPSDSTSIQASHPPSSDIPIRPSHLLTVNRPTIVDDDPRLRMLLEHIATYPFVGVVERFTALGLSRRQGHAAKQALIKSGYVTQVDITTPTGRTALLQLTDTAREWLNRHRVPITPINGSLPHAWWQFTAARWLEHAGWTVELEHRMGDHVIDIHATRDDQVLLLEIETGRSDWLSNISHLEGAGAQHKLVLWLDDTSLARVRSVCPDGIHLLRPTGLRAWLAK